jgi:hypothetical protein
MKWSAQKTFLWWVLKGNLIVWAINGVLFIVLGLTGLSLSTLVARGFLSKVSFLETGVAFLLAGVLAFSGSVLPNKAREQIFKTADEPWSIEKLRRSEKKANKFVALALFLFLESMLIAFLGL